jgi:hypothetical protein
MSCKRVPIKNVEKLISKDGENFQNGCPYF